MLLVRNAGILLRKGAAATGLGIALTMGATALALAQDEAAADGQAGANLSAEVPKGDAEAASPVASAALALQLYEWGKANDDAFSVIAAARILASLGEDLEAASAAGELEPEAEAGPQPEAKEGDAAVPEPATMLAEARALASGDARLVALIDEAESVQSRAFVRPDQIVAGLTTVDAFSEDAWRWRTALGGQVAEVAISGDGDTDLDLFIYDENGYLVCSSTLYGDTEYCSWIPKWTGQFRIVVKNYGPVYNAYRMWIN